MEKINKKMLLIIAGITLLIVVFCFGGRSEYQEQVYNRAYTVCIQGNLEEREQYELTEEEVEYSNKKLKKFCKKYANCVAEKSPKTPEGYGNKSMNAIGQEIRFVEQICAEKYTNVLL